jgi:PAS domain S-box-containing protein
MGIGHEGGAMGWTFSFYQLPILISAIISAGQAVWGLRRRESSVAIPFALMMTAITLWSLFYALELGVTRLPAKILCSKLEYLAIPFAAVSWLLLAFAYTQRTHWLRPRRVAALLVIPVIVLVLAWTNEWHGLIWRQLTLASTGGPTVMLEVTHGAGFYLHIVYSYLSLGIGSFLLAREFIGSWRVYQRQALLMVLGIAAPWAGNLLYVFNLALLHGLDLTPFAFTISGLLFGAALFRLKLFDLTPVARETVMMSLEDAVYVLDVADRVVDLNPAGLALLHVPAKEVLGQPATDVFASQPAMLSRFRAVYKAHTETSGVLNRETRYFDLSIAPLYSRGHRMSGRLVALRDITERRRIEEALREAKADLEARVAERTAALQTANERLQVELAERIRVEQSVRSYAAQLERSNAEVQSFTHISSHHLQEPLRKIRTLGDRLRDKYTPVLGEQGGTT